MKNYNDEKIFYSVEPTLLHNVTLDAYRQGIMKFIARVNEKFSWTQVSELKFVINLAINYLFYLEGMC